MQKQVLTKPVLFLLYGFPGSGKTFFARQFADEVKAAVISDEQLRSEFFDSPAYSKEQNNTIEHLILYMTEQFLKSGISVIIDSNIATASKRRLLKDLSRNLKSESQLIWIQLDVESSFTRTAKRDKRHADDKYAIPLDRSSFEEVASKMQNPTKVEDFVVISGKHAFSTQKNAVIKKLYERSLLSTDSATEKLPKPELINRIPAFQPGRLLNPRRNIFIR